MTAEQKEEIRGQHTAQALRKTLNQHGYSFQYSVLKRVREYSEGRPGSWTFEVAEFPVAVQSTGTRIDFVLSRQLHRYYLLAECKRANPALSNWCFVRAPLYRRNQGRGQVIVEGIRKEGDLPGIHILVEPADVYHLGIEVRANVTGDCSGQGRGAIEDAAGQICRGLNGMIEAFVNLPDLQGLNDTWFIPVIFTTAHIWTSEVDLGSADLASGDLASGTTAVSAKSWIWFQYHLSPTLKHNSAIIEDTSSLGAVLDQLYVRTIAVVSTSGIDEFLSQNWLSE